MEDFQTASCAIMFNRRASSVKAETVEVVEVTRAVKTVRCSCRCCLTLRWAWRVNRMKWLRTRRSELHDYPSMKRLSTT